MPGTEPSLDLSSLISSIPAFRDYVIESTSRITNLWSNYGFIDRVYLKHKDILSTRVDQNPSTDAISLIIKTVQPPPIESKDTKDEGHIRKLLSYKVEQYFYAHLSGQLSEGAKVATYYSPVDQQGIEQPVKLVLEDLSVSFPSPVRGSMGLEDIKIILKWLANFHGTFWGFHHSHAMQESLIPPPLEYQGTRVSGVWAQGTYWYLDTRREACQNTDKDEYDWLLKWTDKVRKNIFLKRSFLMIHIG
jgi:hypothetical protein